MKLWGSIGSYLDGWAKFALMIAAVGWFGLQVADRYAPRSATVTIGHPEATANHAPADVVQTVTYKDPVEAAETTASHSVFSELLREIAFTISLLAANPFAHLAMVLAVGVTGGLAIRPKVNQWREARDVRAARRRADRHAVDLRLLAAMDIDGRVRKQEKRSGREPDDFVGSIPTSVISVPWSNGTTPARHAGSDGSTPSGIN